MRHSSSSATVIQFSFLQHGKQQQKKTVLRIPPFVPDAVRNLSLMKAHRQQTETSSRLHKKLTNATVIQFSFLHYENTQKHGKHGASHSTLRPWSCGESQLPQSSPRENWNLIETSLKINKCDSHSDLISSICQKQKNTKNGASLSTLRPRRCEKSQLPQSSPKKKLTSHWDLTTNKKMRQSFSSHVFNVRNKKDKKQMLRIPPFVPDDLRNRSLLKAHRKQTETSPRFHRKLQNATVIQFSYLPSILVYRFKLF